MTARIFISYRSADGADKATALARDLGRHFGDAQVFLDKDDLSGGSVWRREVSKTLKHRPVLLLLITPQLFDARDDQDRRHVERPDDPVRREVEAALSHGAALIPVLCDGVSALDQLGPLPAPFDHLGERTWRRLRAYDWAKDVQRLIDDLQAHGIRPAGRGRRIWLAGAAVAVGAVLAGAWRWQRRRADGLSGRWSARFAGETVIVELQHDGEQLSFESHPIDVRERPDWADYRAFWLRRERRPLDAVRYRGEGVARTPVGSPLEVDLSFKLLSVPGDVPVDGGGLSATLAADGRTLTGTRWLNSAQAETPVTLTRLD